MISGCVGPQDDGYDPAALLTADAAREYHSAQIETFADTAADMVNAMTLTYVEEAVGVARGELAIAYGACRATRLTVAIRHRGRPTVRRSRRVRAGAGTTAIHGIRPGSVRVTARLGSARAVVRWTRIRAGRSGRSSHPKR